MPLDKGTKIYALILGSLILFALAAVFYQSPAVSRLNSRLQQDPEIAAFPYSFQVVRINGKTAVISTPRSPQVPVARILDTLFPGIGHSDPSSPLFQQMQKKLADVQAKAGKLVLQDPEIDKISWEIDRNWLMQHGISAP